MTPAVPPLPTIWNLPFQPSLGIHTSNCTAGLVTPTTRQIGAAIVPTGFGFTPAGSISVSVIVVISVVVMMIVILREILAQPLGGAVVEVARQHIARGCLRDQAIRVLLEQEAFADLLSGGV